MNPTEMYTQSDVVRWVGQNEVRKAQGYRNSIENLSIRPDAISALVHGTAPKPYQVSIRFLGNRDGGWSISLDCDCPVGYGGCKHSAAVLLAGIKDRESAPKVRPMVLYWIERFSKEAERTSKSATKQKVADKLFYIIGQSYTHDGYRVAFKKGRPDRDGKMPPRAAEWSSVERALSQPPRFVDDDDLAILRLLWVQRVRSGYDYSFSLSAGHADDVLRRMLATGRCYFNEASPVLLTEGDARIGRVEWRLNHSGMLYPDVCATPAISAVLSLKPFWYVDEQQGTAGALTLQGDVVKIKSLLELPPLNPLEAPLVAAALQKSAPDLPIPDVEEVGSLKVVESPPRPVLTIGTMKAYAVNYYGMFSARRGQIFDFEYGTVAFRYDDATVAATDKAEFVSLPNGEMRRIKRRFKEEASRVRQLESFGLVAIPPYWLYSGGQAITEQIFGFEHEDMWVNFLSDTVPRLREAGWDVDVPSIFRHRIIEPDAWHAEIDDSENGWLELTMGIDVEGKRLPLAPLLSALFQADSRWLDVNALNSIPDDEKVFLTDPEGQRIRVAAERLKPLARTLVDLFNGSDENGAMRVSTLDAPRLAELADLKRWQFRGVDEVQKLAKKLQDAQGVKAISPPQGFALSLRPYQLEGLAWLQYLREHDIAGILADDMGLGKTAQTLAHLLLEKEAGRLDRPALVVLPTSLVHNWKREANRFAPDLKVLALQGQDRKTFFDDIPKHNVVLTTYPLLWRDEDALVAQDYHLVVLDEAQTVKNAASKAASVVRKFRTRHRLCLTGTPLENHLGELWSQFDFLLPGFLGDLKTFTKTWRTPIEKQGDRMRQELLARRLKPFMLRRRKEEVAKELPAKTVILRTVDLEGGQRDLYETVRSAMDKKIRDEIANKGFKRSQIVILDALLKLRQVCCDPRLLKMSSAKAVKERAKLDFLMGMLPELVEEGRKILLFSQFTEMLALIEKELEREKLSYSILTGQTKDRETAIKRFQDGDVPIFLISLKAGGVGLNLTAADTVIHYDPWWNPAAENQATDRAHRIGQKKKVFVYKLIVAGSIEEKILALQEKKAELAAGILSEDHGGTVKFGEAELAALLAPLPTND